MWTNADTVAHQVAFKQRNGVQCAQPLVLQPAQSGSCTFTKPGKYDYSDPAAKGNAFRGKVNVAQGPLGITLQAVPKIVTYAGKATLSGAISSAAAGERVTILAQACGQSSFSQVATATTTTGGAFRYVVQPTLNTTYQVRYKSASSGPVVVKVRPRIRLGKVAPRRYSVRVTAAVAFRGKLVYLQRYNASLRRWVTVKRAALRTVVAGIAPNKTTSVTIRVKLKARLKLRVVMPQSQVGACYLAGRSNTILS
jgi:hypothetical protein